MGSLDTAPVSDVAAGEDSLSRNQDRDRSGDDVVTKAKILCLVGTRPEVVKMVPVIRRLKEEHWAEVRILATAQHRALLDEALGHFDMAPDLDLDIMRPDQSLAHLTSRLIRDLDEVIASEQPDVALMQGDTTTVMSAALVCFYREVAVGHVEAGLRTGMPAIPFPRR